MCSVKHINYLSNPPWSHGVYKVDVIRLNTLYVVRFVFSAENR